MDVVGVMAAYLPVVRVCAAQSRLSRLWMFYGIGWWFIISVEQCISLILKGQSGHEECWGRGMCEYVCREQCDWQLVCWKVTGKQAGCWSPEKGCYCSQFGELREGTRCQLVVIVNWPSGCGEGWVVVVLACCMKQNLRAKLIFWTRQCATSVQWECIDLLPCVKAPEPLFLEIRWLIWHIYQQESALCGAAECLSEGPRERSGTV